MAPDPQAVKKLPVARAGERGEIRISAARPAEAEAGPLRLFGADGRLDAGAVCRLVDAAKVIVEGRIYEGSAQVGGPRAAPVFLGTALLTLDLAEVCGADGPVDERFARRVRDALAADRRTVQALHDRAWRETARLLGPETPAALEVTPTLRTRGTTLLADLDLEGPVDAAARG